MQGGKNEVRTRLQDLPLGFVGDSVLFVDLLHTFFFLRLKFGVKDTCASAGSPFFARPVREIITV